MLLIGMTPRLRTNNFLSPLVQTFENDGELASMATQMIYKLQFITKMHGEVKENVYQAQVGKKHAYVIRKGKQFFLDSRKE